MTPEGKVKAQIKKVLEKHGAYYHMPVQNGMGAPTLDFIGCCNGRYIAVEAKAPGKKPTERQEVTMGKIRASGGTCFVVSNADEAAALDAFLTLIGGWHENDTGKT